jgi:hypothetical protein
VGGAARSAVSLGATSGFNDGGYNAKGFLRFYGEGMPNPSAAAAQFGLFPGEGGGKRYGEQDFHGGLPRSARNFAAANEGGSQTAGAPVFGLTWAIKVATVCCSCRCDAGLTAPYNVVPAPGQPLVETCGAYCADEACGAGFKPGVCVPPGLVASFSL